MKQKIKEVRDKFLSNNQIEDIRQNIKLGVEERLKFLNSEQIKVVELLEEKHHELDNTIQKHALKIDADKKFIEEELVKKLSKLEIEIKNKITGVEEVSANLETLNADLDKSLKSEIKESLKNQEISINKKIDQLNIDQLGFTGKFEVTEKHLDSILIENKNQLDQFSKENKIAIEQIQGKLFEKLDQNSTKIEVLIDEKLSYFDDDKKKFLEKINVALKETALGLNEHIQNFSEDHKSVETLIDSRLKEFRNAQKAAFEELEAALNLLEKHQDETITRFKNKNDATNTRVANLPNNFPKNRGSILHQAKDYSNVNIDNKEVTNSNLGETSVSALLKPLVIAGISCILLVAAANHFDIDFSSVFKLTKNLSN